MVTRAAKDLLRNTIRSTDYHNRLIEEEEMWKQWEVEKGLTMMVTDDYLRRRMRMDEYPGPSRESRNGIDARRDRRRKCGSRIAVECEQDNYWSRKLMNVEDKDSERWGHSGYRELYPEEFQPSRCSQSSSSDEYQESKHGKSKRNPEKKHKKKKRHKRRKQKAKKATSFKTDSETEELRRDIRNIQRQKRGLPLIRKPRNDSSSDSDVRIIGVSGPRLPPKRPRTDDADNTVST